VKAENNRSVVLHCPTCGNSLMEFESLDTDPVMIKCPSCGRTMTKDELMDENGEVVDSALDEMKKEIFKDIKDDFRKRLKKSVRGTKSIKIR